MGLSVHVSKNSLLTPAPEDLLSKIVWTTEDKELAAFLLAKKIRPDVVARLMAAPLFGYLAVPKEGIAAWERGDLAGKEAYQDAVQRLKVFVKKGRDALLDTVIYREF